MTAVVGNGLQYEFIIICLLPRPISMFFHLLYLMLTTWMSNKSPDFSSSFSLLEKHMFALSKIAEAV